MLKLSVENWDFLELSRHIKELILEEDWDRSGWMMSDAGEMRVDSITVFTEVLVMKTVTIVKMLVWFARVSTCEANGEPLVGENRSSLDINVRENLTIVCTVSNDVGVTSVSANITVVDEGWEHV